MITKELAEGCLREGNSYQLHEYVAIEDDAAELLSQLADWLRLDGLKCLSNTAADSLGKHAGNLMLCSLEHLSDDAAESLSKHEGDLDLGGLDSLSDAAAKSLSKHTGHLSLNGLKRLSETAAESLGKHEGRLSLDGIEVASDTVVEKLRHNRGDLSLRGLTELSEAVAKILVGIAGEGGSVYLDALEHLSAAVAEVLSNHRGNLSLGGLKTLSDSAAASLSRHRQSLSLDGLTDLTESVAKSLGEIVGQSYLEDYAELCKPEPFDDAVRELTIDELYKLTVRVDELSLNGLKSLSDEAAENLSKYKGFLSLNSVDTLSESARSSFSRMQRGASLNEYIKTIKSLTDSDADVAFAAMLARGRLQNEILEFDSLRELSSGAAKELALFDGWLHLNGLSVISDEVAEHLSCFGIGLDEPEELRLEGVRESSDYAFLLLSTRPNTFLSDSLRANKQDCSEENLTIAKRYLLYPMWNSEVSAMTELTERDASDLARSRLSLSLLGLVDLSDSVAEILSNHIGTLFLSSSCKMSDQARTFLSKHEGPVVKGR
ncbi:hypothetical protein RMSM_03530 [Rhodopirellula maiorica SM1]|uniref:Uncharacterized protein n=1 Tax=Rhodopirellula maiorica SM1 TaxID=1265738 RepID=M5RK16_9BACT|nr:hypothetical protein RMSM_03530 [Rhodopirellula maiorica SM1]